MLYVFIYVWNLKKKKKQINKTEKSLRGIVNKLIQLPEGRRVKACVKRVKWIERYNLPIISHSPEYTVNHVFNNFA